MKYAMLVYRTRGGTRACRLTGISSSSARADLLRRLGRETEAHDAYRRALDLTEDGPERRFLERRLGGAGTGTPQ